MLPNCQVFEKAEKYFLPYVFAALGVVYQLGWFQLADIPKFAMTVMLNPSALLTQLIQPAIAVALVKVREALTIPKAAMGFLKA